MSLQTELETDPEGIGYPPVDSWQAAETAHALLIADSREIWRDVPKTALAGLWDLHPWDSDPLVSVYDGLTALSEQASVAGAVAKKALRLIDVSPITTLEMSDATKRAAIVGMLDMLLAGGMSQAAYDATLALARTMTSRAAELGLSPSPADVWEAFGWPGRLEPGKRPPNRDPETGEMVP